MSLILGIDIGGSSVKAAALTKSTPANAGPSDKTRVHYNAADAKIAPEAIARAITQACQPLIDSHGPPAAIGLCLPGLFDHETRTLTRSINLPDLVGHSIDELLTNALPGTPTARIVTDAFAAGFDVWSRESGLTVNSKSPVQRWFMLSIGTGVGACVLDNGNPLHVSGTSPGHFGQLDVSLNHDAPIGTDGGKGSLEGYIGLAALCRKHGCEPRDAASRLGSDADALAALARALRIAHAIYRPHHIRLLGGIGTRLGPAKARLITAIGDQLTSIARSSWTLDVGSSDFHAAAGAARLAARA